LLCPGLRFLHEKSFWRCPSIEVVVEKLTNDTLRLDLGSLLRYDKHPFISKTSKTSSCCLKLQAIQSLAVVRGFLVRNYFPVNLGDLLE
jgi:hypothetical protein